MYKKLEALLIEQSVTKHKLARSLDITYNTLLLKLNGKYRFTLDEALATKSVLKTEVPLEELFANSTT